MSAELEALLARGGWAIEDAQARHRAHPDTFALPPEAELDALAPGSMARLLFTIVDQADEGRDGIAPFGPDGAPALVEITERMWLFVEAVDGDRVSGWMESRPTGSHTALAPGCRVTFARRDVIDTRPADLGEMQAAAEVLAQVGWSVRDEDDGRRPVDPARTRAVTEDQQAICDAAGVRPEPPYFMTGATFGRDLAAGAWPIYGLRFRPSSEHGQCGWFVWAGDPQFDAQEWELAPAGELRKRRPEAERFLALPPGWGFACDADGAHDVWADPGLT